MPSRLSCTSVPAKRFFSFSAAFAIFSSSLADSTQLIPPTISLQARSIPAITSSFTPLALAPGVLNTTIPFSAHFSRGMLLTPAPALATARRLSGNWVSCIEALRTSTPWASSMESVKAYWSVNRSVPHLEILLTQWIFLMPCVPPQTLS